MASGDARAAEHRRKHDHTSGSSRSQAWNSPSSRDAQLIAVYCQLMHNNADRTNHQQERPLARSTHRNKSTMR